MLFADELLSSLDVESGGLLLHGHAREAVAAVLGVVAGIRSGRMDGGGIADEVLQLAQSTVGAARLIVEERAVVP